MSLDDLGYYKWQACTIEVLAEEICNKQNGLAAQVMAMVNERVDPGEEFWTNLLQFCMMIGALRRNLVSPTTPNIVRKDLREIVRDVSFGTPLIFHQVLKNIIDNTDTPDELRALLKEYEEWTEIDVDDESLADSFGEDLKSILSPSSLIDSGVFLLEIEHLPEYLEQYVQEARLNLALGNKVSVAVLCRTILEICLNDVKYRDFNDNVEGTPPPRSEMSMSIFNLIMDVLCDKPELSKRANKIRCIGNLFVHPESSIEKRKTIDMRELFRDTLLLIDEIYRDCLPD